MPVEESYQVTWPVYRRDFRTIDARPIYTVLARADSAGYAALLPEIQVVGRTADGTRATVLAASYSLIGLAGSTEGQANRQDIRQYGIGAFSISIASTGRELHLACAGADGVAVSWCAFWRVVELPPL